MVNTHLVIGVGNEFRADDAVGLIISRQISALNLPQVLVVEHNGEGAGLIDAWESRQAESVVIVDAVYSGTKPGTIIRFDAREQTIPTSFFSYSTHLFSLAEAIELSRVLGKLPPKLVIYGIEGSHYRAGSALSAAVGEAIPITLAKIIEEIGVVL